MSSQEDAYIDEYIEHTYRCLEYYLTLSEDEKKAMSKYKGWGYEEINNLLLKKPLSMYDINNDNIESIKKIPTEIHTINKILMNAPAIQNDIMMYRGQTIPISPDYTYQNKLVFTNMNFMSMSMFSNISLSFTTNMCCLYKIHIPKATPLMIMLDPFNDVSSPEDIDELVADYESEMVLPPGCSFSVDTKSYKTDKEVRKRRKQPIRNKDLKNIDKREFKEYITGENKTHVPIETKTLHLLEYAPPDFIAPVETLIEEIRLDVKLKSLEKLMNPTKEEAKEETTED